MNACIHLQVVLSQLSTTQQALEREQEVRVGQEAQLSAERQEREQGTQVGGVREGQWAEGGPCHSCLPRLNVWLDGAGASSQTGSH